MAIVNYATSANVAIRNGRRSYNGTTWSPGNPNANATLTLIYTFRGFGSGVGGRAGVFIGGGTGATNTNVGVDGWAYLGEARFTGAKNGSGQQVVVITVAVATMDILALTGDAFLKVALVPRENTEMEWGFTLSEDEI